ncbi:hypothetical protein PN498_03255 [Oscillatoria sp. CS-180]|nr:hypothetical protein [Oscillatoria sp. CS-180]MDB9524993.1 hypothetical protein [Oscillatoria sp. CS-180]
MIEKQVVLLGAWSRVECCDRPIKLVHLTVNSVKTDLELIILLAS